LSAGEDPERARERRALDEAWDDIIHGAARNEALDSLLAVLLGAVTGTPGEEAEADPPGVAVLRTVRATVDAWAHARSESTLFAAVAFVELDLLVRRLDAAVVLVKRNPGGVRC